MIVVANQEGGVAKTTTAAGTQLRIEKSRRRLPNAE
jgi:hypothetical protein